MGSKGKLLFDLNEPPTEDDEAIEETSCIIQQPQRVVPSSNIHPPALHRVSTGHHGFVNNHAFSHKPSLSSFQPYSRPRSQVPVPELQLPSPQVPNPKILSPKVPSPEVPTFKVPSPEVPTPKVPSPEVPTPKVPSPEVPTPKVPRSEVCQPINQANTPHKVASSSKLSTVQDVQPIEKEEGEWSDDAEGDKIEDLSKVSQVLSNVKEPKTVENTKKSETIIENMSRNAEPNEDENRKKSYMEVDNNDNNDKKSVIIPPVDDSSGVNLKQKGVETSHAMKSSNKRPKIDLQKEAMLGKKRSRQTMFLNLEDVPSTVRSSTPKRQNFPLPVTTTRVVKETRPVIESSTQTKQQGDLPLASNEGIESSDSKSEFSGEKDMYSRPRRFNSSSDLTSETRGSSIPRHNSWKQSTDSRQQPKLSQVPVRKSSLTGQSSIDPKSKRLPLKKQPGNSSSTYQDTSVERLLREVTSEKFWHHPEEAELQSVPGQFESVEDYVRVFEPLLFEECRAQLYSTWEELTESRDPHIKVWVKSVERRERGWYDVILMPENECKWTFKEGEVAVISSLSPRSVKSRRSSINTNEETEESEKSGRVAGTVRRHIPIDTRERMGAILHFYVGDSFDTNSKIDDDHILRKLQHRSVWFLSVLGTLATTQREYIGLHAFRRLNSEMQNAILQPSSEHFPKYEEQSPTVPDCFTPNFVGHLHKTFNEPQLGAIQWAATHTAAGTNNGGPTTKKQDPWPFTLVQGPPGTGKTHTVWGMLNVIHLVQYQHYYTALLKKLAPESYKQVNEHNSDVASGSIDELLLSMDQNLFRTLPKLCPKPRMLVCAPSNAATDELLSRVLDRGFIDGEMKMYRPDVARVGVDSQTRAAQAVSVERRTEQLLMKSREDIYGYINSLRVRESQLSQQIVSLQRELTVAAAAGRSQGSVGVDPDVLMARDQSRDSMLQTLAAIVENRDKVLVEMSRLVIIEGKFRPNTNFNLDEARASLEASFANEAEIVFTTLSSSGRKLFSRLTHGFDMVVIDEAAQASEVALLPPLSLGAARCVLVGDPQQLPATVISKAAGTLLYSRSLFERFQQAGCPTMLLSVQYRMHPQIRDFPSRYFYQGRLTDSESIVNLPDELFYKDPLLKPYVFYDITHGRESHRGGSVSFENIHEAQFCVKLYEHLVRSCKSLGIGKVSVGIITPYKLQLKCLKREFRDVLNSEEGKDIYINTVDAFQGQERDVIIMSCVRASNNGVGFVADIRRMNVALTRAKRALWVMGNANALVKCDDWAALIADAKSRNCYMNMDSLPKEFLAPKALPPSGFSSKISNNRSFRPTRRHRPYDTHMESRSGTPSEEDEKSNSNNNNNNNASSMVRNGSYRSFKPQTGASLEDFDRSGDRSRDSWQQQGFQKKQNSSGVLAKRDM